MFPEIARLSPHFTRGALHERRGVLVHHSVMAFEATIAHMLDPQSEVSYHALISTDGTRCTLVADEHVAWHAGVSVFQGRTRCNDFLLGLAFAGDTYRDPLSADQIASALEWLRARWTRYGWLLAMITDHRQVAPERKNDLNPVEWRRLHAAIAAEFGASIPQSAPLDQA